jgi:hypothetical protein
MDQISFCLKNVRIREVEVTEYITAAFCYLSHCPLLIFALRGWYR